MNGVVKQIIKKYVNIPKAAKASLWFILCSIMQRGITFLTTPIFTRVLSTDEYGQFTFYQSIYAVVYVFSTLELASGVYNKGLIKFKEDRDRFTSSMLGLSSFATVCLFLVYLIFHNFFIRLSGLPNCVFLLMFLDLLLAPATTFWTMRQRFDYNYIVLVCVSITISIISPTIGLLLVMNSTEKGIIRIISVCAVNACFGLVFYIYIMSKGKKIACIKYWKYGLWFNVPLIPHYLSSIVLAQADRIMIKSYFGTSAVAKYSVAYSISMLMNIVVYSVNAAFIPWVYQKCDLGDFKEIRKYSTYILVLIGTITMIPILAAPELLKIIAPEQYGDAVHVIPPVALSVFFVFLYTLYCNIEFAFEKNRFTTVASTIAGISNIILNIIFMNIYGFIAAAYTTLFCYIIMSIAHYVFYKQVLKSEKIERIYNSKLYLFISLIVCICSFSVSLLYNYIIIRYLLIFGILLLGYVFRKRIIEVFSDIREKRG